MQGGISKQQHDQNAAKRRRSTLVIIHFSFLTIEEKLSEIDLVSPPLVPRLQRSRSLRPSPFSITFSPAVNSRRSTTVDTSRAARCSQAAFINSTRHHRWWRQITQIHGAGTMHICARPCERTGRWWRAWRRSGEGWRARKVMLLSSLFSLHSLDTTPVFVS